MTTATATKPETATVPEATVNPAATNPEAAAATKPAATKPAATNPAAATDPFGEPATQTALERTAAALSAKGYDVRIAANGDEARDVIISLLPEGAEVGQGASTTLEVIGVTHEIEESGRFDAVRKHTRSMDRSRPQGLRAMRKLGVAPDWYVNSAHAVTYDGTIVTVSNTGSQLAPLAFGAGHVIWAIGSQKLVPDLETAMQRIEEHTLALENQRMQGIYGIDSEIKKVLIIHKESRPERFTVVLIKEPVGF